MDKIAGNAGGLPCEGVHLVRLRSLGLVPAFSDNILHMPEEHRIALQIRLLRRMKGLTQHELSNLSGVSYNAIVKLESLIKPANPTVRTLEKVAGVLGVNTRELLQQPGNEILDQI